MVKTPKKIWDPRNPIRPVRRSSMEFDDMGQDIEDVPKITKRRSFWAIDDSGTPDFAPRSSEYLTLTAVTTLTDEDFSKLFKNISKYDGEVKFSVLRVENSEECLTVMRRIGRSTALILCYPRYKDPENPRNPNEFFVESLKRLIDGIMKIDRSDLIIIGVDDNPYLEPTDYFDLCSPRCIVHPVDSKESMLVQIADLSTSSLGHGLLPAKYGDSTYFDEIKKKSVNVHGKPDVSTQQTPIGFNRDIIESVDADLNIATQEKKSAPESKSQKRGSKGRSAKDSKVPNIKALSPKNGSRGSRSKAPARRSSGKSKVARR